MPARARRRKVRLVFVFTVCLPLLCEIAEAGEFWRERQFNHTDGAVTLFADDDFGLASAAARFGAVALGLGHALARADSGGFGQDDADFTDARAAAAIIRLTAGNFRLLQRLFMQIERIARINEIAAINEEVVAAAAQTLVIGNAN